MTVIPSPKRIFLTAFSKYQPWLVCISAAFFFFYEFIQMGMFNSISQELMRDFSISAGELGFLSATYFYADVIFLLIAGVLVDRISVRAIIITAMFMVVTSTFIFSFTHSLPVAAFCHFISGIGNAFCFLSCIKLATRWFENHRLAFVIGVIITIAMLGGVVAQTPVTLLTAALGWRNTILITGGLGIVIIFLVFAFVKDYPVNYQKDKTFIRSADETANFLSLKKSILAVLANKQNTLGGLYTCFLNLPIILLGELWGLIYLTQVHSLTKKQASIVTTMIFVGTILGSPLVGWFSDVINKRKLPMVIGGILALLVFLCIMFLPKLNFSSLLFLFLLLGLFTSTQIISYPLIAESNPKYLAGTSTGFASILIMGGGVVFQPLFGWLMDLSLQTSLAHEPLIYSHKNYTYSLSIIPIAFLLGIIAASFVRETHCKPYSRGNL